MILCIDIGNTHTVFGCFDDDKNMFVSRTRTVSDRTVDEFAVLLLDTLKLYDVSLDSISGTIVSCVVPPLNKSVKRSLTRLTGKSPLMVSPSIKLGFPILIDNVNELGSDIICAAVAAIESYTLPLLVVDLGTATKFSAVDKSGNFVGVSIMPGVEISLRALSQCTAQLPAVDRSVPPVSIIGKNSIDSMKSGVIFGTASMIDGMTQRFLEELGGSLIVIATGGIAGDIVPYCKNNITLDEELVLKGLRLIYERNDIV